MRLLQLSAEHGDPSPMLPPSQRLPLTLIRGALYVVAVSLVWLMIQTARSLIRLIP